MGGGQLTQSERELSAGVVDPLLIRRARAKLQPVTGGRDPDCVHALQDIELDLHAGGAFTDDDAPVLNRSIRNALFEAWTADNSLSAADAPVGPQLRAWYEDQDHPELGDPTGTEFGNVLASVCRRAVLDVMHTRGADTAEAEELADVATRGVCESYNSWLDVVGTDNPSPEALFAFSFNLASIPDYWEPAELSTEFQELLEAEVDPGA